MSFVPKIIFKKISFRGTWTNSRRRKAFYEQIHRPKEHKCETCGKEFRWLKLYQKHISEHKNLTKQKAASKHVNKRGNMSEKKRRVNVKSVNNQEKVTGKKKA